MHELQIFLSQYHDRSVSKSETQSILDMADLDANGKLNFSEFYRCTAHCNSICRESFSSASCRCVCSIYACLQIVNEQFKVDDVKLLQPKHVRKALESAGLEPTQVCCAMSAGALNVSMRQTGAD
mgnify:CR=1 FL=1